VLQRKVEGIERLERWKVRGRYSRLDDVLVPVFDFERDQVTQIR